MLVMKEKQKEQKMIYIACVAGIFLLDFFIKRKIDHTRELDEEEMVCAQKIILTKYYNKGAMLNFLDRWPKAMTAIHTTILAGITVVYGFVLKKRDNPGLKLGLSMMLGGGLSNLYDRFTRHHVVDYFRFNVRLKKLRNIIFNISDLFVFLGGVLAVLFGSKK
jgi:signal peptidase II